MAIFDTPSIDKFTVKEVLNKVINTGEDALKVDIDNVTLKTEGSDINIEVHTDKAEDSMLMFSHTVASGTGGTSLVPLVDSAGHLQIDVLTTPATDAIYVDDADWSDGSSKHMLVGGLYQSSPQSITDGDVGPFQVDANGRLGVALSPTDNAVLDAIETTNNANQVLLGTIDSDTDAIKTATESSNTHLGNMFYDTALAVTPSDGSDLSGEPYFAVWVGTGGNLKVDMADGGSAVTLNNCASGQLIPIMVERIYATGTTASNIIVFK